ncbi:MAG: hypothetical protein ACK4M9_00995 [Anaerobacillus sp.]|uniref:hypothetical protein n=1 Tax=Anaerobacillus sp. TaxID=1872506 RepID=UPI00391DAB67
MTWFSYFLMNAPESFILLALPFALFGISIRENLKPLIVFALTQGLVAFMLSVYMHTSFKPFLTFLSFCLLVFYIFRFSFLKALVITLSTFVLLVIFEIITTLSIVQFLNISYDDIFSNPWLRILISLIMVQLPMLLTIFVLLKFKVKIKLPAFLNR